MENLDYKDEVKKTNLFYQIQQYQHDEELVQPSKYHVDSDNADNEWKSKQWSSSMLQPSFWNLHAVHVSATPPTAVDHL